MKFLAKNYKCQLNFKLLHKQIILSFSPGTQFFCVVPERGLAIHASTSGEHRVTANNKTIYLTFLLIATNLLNFYLSHRKRELDFTGSHNNRCQDAIDTS